MIAFRFRVNPSFRNYSSHPITIPRSKIDYQQVADEDLLGAVTAIDPSGVRLSAQVYSGIAGFGHYLQIRFDSRDSRCLKNLPLGNRCWVILGWIDGARTVLLKPMEI